MRFASSTSRRALFGMALGMVAFAPLLAPARAAQEAKEGEKVVLVLKAKAGNFVRTKSEGVLALKAGGMDLQMELKQTVKNTYKSVDEKTGEITYETVTEENKQLVNGQEFPGQDAPVVTVIVRPNNTVVKYKSENADFVKIAGRLSALSSIVFSKEAVGVGSKWTHEFKANEETGVRAGKAEYEVLAFEKLDGIDTVKIKSSYKDAEGNPATTASQTAWIEKSSGDIVKSETEMKDLELGEGGMAAQISGKLVQKRSEGSPLGDAPAKKDK